MDRTANIGKAEGSDATVQCRDNGTYQHGEHADERPRRNTWARVRGTIVRMTKGLRRCAGAS
jgi:hypothetical protein